MLRLYWAAFAAVLRNIQAQELEAEEGKRVSWGDEPSQRSPPCARLWADKELVNRSPPLLLDCTFCGFDGGKVFLTKMNS
jgi:hypothetical protein